MTRRKIRGAPGLGGTIQLFCLLLLFYAFRRLKNDAHIAFHDLHIEMNITSNGRCTSVVSSVWYNLPQMVESQLLYLSFYPSLFDVVQILETTITI